MPIFAEYRPLFKISQILLILFLNSRGGKSSLIRMQLFNWSLKDPLRVKVLTIAANSGVLNLNVWGMDPSLNSAIQFGMAEGLIERNSNGISITEAGRKYVGAILKDEEFKGIYSVLIDIGKSITEKMVTQSSESWG